MKIKCNWCETVFEEEDILVLDGEEYCPKCEETGYLMDDIHDEFELKG